MAVVEEIIQYVKAQQEGFLDILQELVNRESYVYAEKMEKRECAEYVEELFSSLGFVFQRIEDETAGTHLFGTLGDGSKTILLMSHYDTVFPTGTTATRPYSRDAERAYGPGIFDMKGGILVFYAAIKALQDLQLMPVDTKIICFISADEEGGSVTSRDAIIDLAKKSDVCLCTEPGQSIEGAGYVCNGRFGRAVFTVKASGTMAHTGHNPQSNPAVEISRQADHISAMCRTDDGKLFSSIVSLHGGESGATAMTPGEAYLIVDIRFADEEHKQIALNLMENLQSSMDEVTLELSGGIEKPPLVQTEKSLFVVQRAKEIIEALGVEFMPTTVGGGSDGNFTSGAGCPTLDGLGLNGKFLHNPQEYITLKTIPERVALTAELIRTVL